MATPTYLAAISSTGDLLEVDAANGANNSGLVQIGGDLTGSPTAPKVAGLMGYDIYGAFASPQIDPQAGQVLAFSGPMPSGTGLTAAWYPRDLPRVAQYKLMAGEGPLPKLTAVNLYDDATDNHYVKFRKAELSGTTQRPAHGFLLSDVSAAGELATVVLGTVLGGFVNNLGQPILTAGSWYWVDPATPGGITSIKPSIGSYHQRVGYAISGYELYVMCLPIEEDMAGGAGSGGGNTNTIKAAKNLTGSTLIARTPVNLYPDGSGGVAMRKSDVTTSASPVYPVHGFLVADTTNGNTGNVMLLGIMGGFSGLTVGKYVWGHDTTVGFYTVNDPFDFDLNRHQLIGLVVSATEILIDPFPVEDNPLYDPNIQVMKAHNATGSTLTARTAVQLTGTTPNAIPAGFVTSGSPVFNRGFVLKDIPNGQDGLVVVSGPMSGWSGLTPNTFYWLSNSSMGAITATPPTGSTEWQQRVGVALNDTTLYVLPPQSSTGRAASSGPVRTAWDENNPVVPIDGRTSGGNTRGTHATDLQYNRSAADQVAGGDYSFIGGGYDNKVETSALGGVIPGGIANTVSKNYGAAIGNNAWSRRWGEVALSAGNNSWGAGSAQTSLVQFWVETTDDTQTEIFLDGYSERLILEEGRAFTYDLRAIARATDGSGTVNSWRGQGDVFRESGGDITLQNNTLTSSATPAPGSWVLAVEADTTNQALVVKVTGNLSYNTRWHVSLWMYEVG